MTVISTVPDTATLTMTVVAELAAPPKRAWQLWVDPRQLERWWGPPTWPATFERHDVAVGGGSSYFMTGPDGDRARGWWRFVALDEPHSLEFEDGFADATGAPDPTMPMTNARVDLVETAEGTRMTVTTRFASLEQMEQLVSMGMVEGMTAAMGQIDGILADR
ncbi:SRPBCC domain-containing protein [Pengzhenrongella phosphoraccumulans]|uniref:SRPBCC family protein n=1 Tax=Pengzhenrongella phosphoraccumulans TaxID=3114394 RepID=UPI00388E3DCD